MDADIRKVRIQRLVLEGLVEEMHGRTELHWGEPDAEGIYTPVVFRTVNGPRPTCGPTNGTG